MEKKKKLVYHYVQMHGRPKELYKKILKLTDFGNKTGYKINTQQSIAFVYIIVKSIEIN